MALLLMAVLGIAILLLLAAIYRDRQKTDGSVWYEALIGINNDKDVEYISEHSGQNGSGKGSKDNGSGKGNGNGSGTEDPGRNGEDIPGYYELDVKCIMQLPELPAGCEAVSLTMVLNYMGFNVDKFTVVDEYLPMGEIGETDPSEAFVGNPYDRLAAYGCYAPVIVKTANSYFADNEYGYVAVDISGEDIETIARDYVYRYGRPAIVWASRYMEEIYQGRKWVVNGKEIYWRHNNHCMALTGWDSENYIVADPLSGTASYPKELFEIRYEQNRMNAVFIFTQREYDEFLSKTDSR